MIQILNTDSLIVCIDGGGTQSRFRVFDKSANAILSVSDGPASLSYPDQIARESILSGLASIRTELKLPTDWMPAELLMGLAGASRKDRCEAMLASLPSMAHTRIITDGHAQLLGVSSEKSAACLAIGTGSVLSWFDDTGQVRQVGGWGFPAGDEGGAGWIGLKAINSFCWWIDAGRVPESVLFDSLEQRFGHEAGDIQNWTTCSKATEVAGLAQLVTTAAENGDEFAAGILLDAVSMVERMLKLAPARLPVCLVGGLAPYYSTVLSAEFRNRLRKPEGDAMQGLLRLSKLAESDQ